MRCRIVRRSTDPKGVNEVRDVWRCLQAEAATPPARHTQTEQWAYAYWAADTDGTACWFVAEDDDGPLAVLQGNLTRRQSPLGPVRQLANGYQQGILWGDGLISARCSPAALWRELLATFARAGEPIDMVYLAKMHEESAFLALARATSGPVEEEWRYGGYSMVPTDRPADDWFGAASKNLRGSIRKARNRLERAGSSRVTVARTPEDVQSAFDRYVDLEAQGWKAGAGALANRPRELIVLREFLQACAETDQASIRTLWVDDQVAAMHLEAVVGSRLVLFKITYNQSLSQLAPGTLLMADLVRSCCDDPDVQVIDLLTDYDWHDRWKPTKHPSFQARRFNRRRLVGLAGAATATVRRTVRPPSRTDTPSH
jgi:CelD/BcsL family acetyltransferase involved in cellulose biosynthesis